MDNMQLLSSPLLAWPLLFLAVITETIWFIVTKKAGGLEIWPWNLLSFIIPLLDTALIALPLKYLPIGTAYAFWTGSSAVLITIFGIYLFGEAFTFWRLFFISIIIIGLVGVNLTK